MERCLSSTPEELTLYGSSMEPQMAIDKEVLDKSKDEKVTHKDNRNLYLIKEGGKEMLFYYEISKINLYVFDFNNTFAMFIF